MIAECTNIAPLSVAGALLVNKLHLDTFGQSLDLEGIVVVILVYRDLGNGPNVRSHAGGSAALRTEFLAVSMVRK